MIIKYDTIESNLKIFEDAKKEFPILQKYINGEVTIDALRSAGISELGNFYEFIKMNKSYGADPIMKNMTWRKLKPILIANTTSERFKTYLKNRTQNEFIAILKNEIAYDKLLNGRWIRKPGRRRSGRRSDEKISAFRTHALFIVNFIIQNDIEIGHPCICGAEWYTVSKLNLDRYSIREMRVSEDLLNTVVNAIEESKIDFKKLNLNYINNFISTKLTKLMCIPEGTNLKCIRDVYSTNNPGIKYLTDGKYYTVVGSYIRDGYLYVSLDNDRGGRDSYAFSNFEDVTFARNSILDSLLG